MPCAPTASSRRLLLMQGALAFAVILLIALLPPARGAMMIVPFDAGGRGAVLAMAASDARLLGPGPLPHSLIVLGDRATVARAAWRHDSVVLAGAFAGCATKAQA